MTFEKRYHNTCKETVFLDRKYEQYPNGYDLKPIGLWYSFGRCWKEWCGDNMPERLHKNDFEIEINADKVVGIRGLSEARDFTDAYRDERLHTMNMFHVDWRKVVELYSGIEIPNYWQIKAESFRSGPPFLTWLYAWDVPSGCIWDLSDVVSIKKLKTNE